MLAIPGSVHIGSARSTRPAIQVLAPHLESAVFISCNLEPWRLGRDRFELREMFGRTTNERYRHGGTVSGVTSQRLSSAGGVHLPPHLRPNE